MVQVIHWQRPARANEETVKQDIRASGMTAGRWTGEPNKHWDGHRHSLQKTLWCASGGIVFHVEGSDYHLKPGDKLILPEDTVHSADAGPAGVVCFESPPVHENTTTHLKNTA